jgi:hypothetical protein
VWINGEGSPRPLEMHRMDATLHSQNIGYDYFSHNSKVEDHTRTANRGGGRDPPWAFNDQWNSTTDASTQRHNSFIYWSHTVASDIIIWTD